LRPTQAKKLVRHPLLSQSIKLSLVVHACYPSYSEGINRRIVIQTSLGKNARLYLKKITEAKRPEGIDQVVEGLPSMLKALRLSPRAIQKKFMDLFYETVKLPHDGSVFSMFVLKSV
jgi:hypothetical protein